MPGEDGHSPNPEFRSKQDFRDLLTYLQLYLLEVKHTDLWDFVYDVEPVMLLVCDWIPQ